MKPTRYKYVLELDETDEAILKTLSERLRIPQSEILRRALRELAKREIK